MNPKEKAKELIDKCYLQLKWALLSHSHKFVFEVARTQAIITVDEIITQLKRDTTPHEPETIDGELIGIRYWQQVKELTKQT